MLLVLPTEGARETCVGGSEEATDCKCALEQCKLAAVELCGCTEADYSRTECNLGEEREEEIIDDKQQKTQTNTLISFLLHIPISVF